MSDLNDLGLPTYMEADNSSKAVFVLCNSQKSPVQYDILNAVEILKNPTFNKSLKTVIYIHGFLDGLYASSVQTVIQAYIERGDHNIIMLDWHAQAEPGYFSNAIPNVNYVGDQAAIAILKMLEVGLSLEKLHLVGHSLGGEMVGAIGRQIQKRSNGQTKLKRITALDPAYPGFYEFPVAEHVTKQDAEFVDVIHTDAGLYGTPYTTGTVDFWPNGGFSPQPGCERWILPLVDACSHFSSWVYWSESVAGKYKKEFNAVRARNWIDFQQGNIIQTDTNVVMGIDCPTNVKGNFYLVTNSISPFAQGEKGIVYEKTILHTD